MPSTRSPRTSALARAHPRLRPHYGQPGNRLIFELRGADRAQRTEDAEMAMLGRHLDDLRQPEGEAGCWRRCAR
ncbi:MAG: hypothetical protein U1E17_06970 [Geminicoccaceae bacterium]